MANSNPNPTGRFQKGKSGNPGGRKQTKKWTAAIEAALAEKDPESKKTKLVLVARALVAAAIDGDVPAMREIGDRLEGKAPQPQVLQGDKENPVVHVHELAFRSNI